MKPFITKEKKLLKALTKRYGKVNGRFVYEKMAREGNRPNNFGYRTKRMLGKEGER